MPPRSKRSSENRSATPSVVGSIHKQPMKPKPICLYGAIVCSIGSTLLICVSFSSDFWLQLATPKYNVDSLGLWNVCRRIQEWYGHYSLCFSVLNDRMAPDFFRPPFYVTVQVFFTLCLLLAVTVLVLLLVAACCGGTALVKSSGLALFWSAIFGAVGLIVFAGCKGNFWWLTNEDHAYLGWSYWVGVVGVIIEVVGSILYLSHFRKTEI